MLDAATQTRLLANYPMLGELPADLLGSLSAGAQLLRLPAGTVVFDENQPCQGFPLILSGNVRVIKASPHGRELQLYRVDPGESCILTSSCLMGHTRYQARGEVEHDVEMVVLPAPVFRRLVSSFEPFRDYIFGLFSERLTDMMQLVSAVAFQKLDQRLAALLLTKPNPLRTTHQQLADELGSVREMVSRLLKQFADQGWVRLGREQIEVVDAAGLKRYSML
ncbi:Crp/Fnr family transcriptional regulator [Ferriphaselus sp. R-1]|uniref:Crp/Fnr family transcriptional regulator n=1 Tax=Ferriphaselus sp. R-1 TaxID=1485544 RepID=UPI00055913AB|nr:Crp/Fnr family transcriptional regulator [Ferriphaselus sp. R-1]